eukprot:168416-Chlamydomonas_euryale.AAC.3
MDRPGRTMIPVILCRAGSSRDAGPASYLKCMKKCSACVLDRNLDWLVVVRVLFRLWSRHSVQVNRNVIACVGLDEVPA